MRRILLLTAILLSGCSPVVQEKKLEFPNSSYGKAMQCLNENYYSLKNGINFSDDYELEQRVRTYCNEAHAVEVSGYLYTGRANLDKNSNINVNIRPKGSSDVYPVFAAETEKTIDHILVSVELDIFLFAKRDSALNSSYDGAVDENGCYDNEIKFYATARKVNDDNSISDDFLVTTAILGDTIADVSKKDKCFKSWLETEALPTPSSIYLDNEYWGWSISGLNGLYFSENET